MWFIPSPNSILWINDSYEQVLLIWSLKTSVTGLHLSETLHLQHYQKWIRIKSSKTFIQWGRCWTVTWEKNVVYNLIFRYTCLLLYSQIFSCMFFFLVFFFKEAQLKKYPWNKPKNRLSKTPKMHTPTLFRIQTVAFLIFGSTWVEA